jgi:hypothetical protein
MNRNALALALALAFPTTASVVGFAGDAAADPVVRVVAPVPFLAPVGPVVEVPVPGPVYVGEGYDARWRRDHRGWDHRGDHGRGRRGHDGRGRGRGRRGGRR